MLNGNKKKMKIFKILDQLTNNKWLVSSNKNNNKKKQFQLTIYGVKLVNVWQQHTKKKEYQTLIEMKSV